MDMVATFPSHMRLGRPAYRTVEHPERWPEDRGRLTNRILRAA